MSICPDCGPFNGLGICPTCGTDVRVSGAVATEDGERRGEHRPPTQRTFTLPWSCLVSDNKKKQRAGPAEAEYRAKKEACELRLMEQTGPSRPVWPEAHVSVGLRFYPPDRRRRDMNNLLKALCDASEGIVVEDDWQVSELWWRRMQPTDEARCEMVVTRVESEEGA